MRGTISIVAATVAFGAVSMIAFGAAAGERHPRDSRFSMTGSYEGVFACDDITDGVSSGYAAPATVEIIQTDERIDLKTTYNDTNGPESLLYRGAVQTNRRHDTLSGFFESCGGTYATRELARIFPTSIQHDGFAFSADSIFQSTAAPGLEGQLVVESCKYVLTRTSTEAPHFDGCD